MMPWYMYPAEGFGLGKLPVAPGTWGTLGGVLLYLPGIFYLPGWLLAVLVILLVIGAIPVCNWSSLYMAQHDPQNVVIDEIIGIWIALWPVTWLHSGVTVWTGIIIGFVLFRFFDITKFFPANVLETLNGGWGIVFDDLIAGIYTNIGLVLLTRYYL